MARSLVVRKPRIQFQAKVKTGCVTCRIRKIKCDEKKPACRRCVDTGRKCDGYESPFILFAGQPTTKTRAGSIKSGTIVPHTWHISTDVSPQAIALLGRCFSTKTLFDIKLGCDEEAKEVLQVSLTNPVVRHAVASLRALREDLETHGDVLASVAQQTPSYGYGLQQYCMALGGLASNLSAPGPGRLKSALLCCQIFFSIEQVQGHCQGMARHLIQGLRIMDQYGARPKLVAADHLMPAYHEQLPLLDVFVIKLFVAPCRFAEPPAPADPNGTAVAKCPLSQPRTSATSCSLRVIAPDSHAELTRIATITLEFLGKMSRVKSAEEALLLLPIKASLLSNLDQWLMKLELAQASMVSSGPEPVSVSFKRLFHQALKVILTGTLNLSSHLSTELQTEHERLLCIAVALDKRLETLRVLVRR